MRPLRHHVNAAHSLNDPNTDVTAEYNEWMIFRDIADVMCFSCISERRWTFNHYGQTNP